MMQIERKKEGAKARKERVKGTEAQSGIF